MSTLGFVPQLLIILCASLVAALAFRRLQLPPIIAYIVVGALIGPQLLGWISEPWRFELIAEYGVAFLLFSIGLEFSFSHMLRLRFAVFGLGTVQVVTCLVAFAAALLTWGASFNAALIVAGALALSSTAIVSRELHEQQQFHSRYAQLSMGVLLFQDLAAVIFLILVPILGQETQAGFGEVLLVSMIKGLLFFAVLMSAGKWILPAVYREVARSNSEEIFGITTLVIALVSTWLAHGFGLSMALGGFVTGMMLSETPYRHQITSDIRPFKDILLSIFFVTVGMKIELSLIQDYWPRLLAFTAGLILFKIIIVGLVVRLMGETAFISMRAAIALAQAGEFGLALVTLAYLNGIIPAEQESFIIIIASFSMLVSPMLIRNSKAIAEFLLSHLPGSGETVIETHPVTLHESGHVLIGGFGRVGQTVARLLDDNEVPYIGIDHNIEIVSECVAKGRNVIYGDCTRLEILNGCNIAEARLAILTFRSVDLAKQTIREIRRKNIEVPIIVRCYEHGNFEELISIGADWVVSEMLEASLLISSQVLSILDIDPRTIEEQLEQVRASLGVQTRRSPGGA